MRGVLLGGACKNTAIDRAMTTRSMGDGNLKPKRGAPEANNRAFTSIFQLLELWGSEFLLKLTRHTALPLS